MENCESPNCEDCPIYNLKCFSRSFWIIYRQMLSLLIYGVFKTMLISPFAWCIPPSDIMLYILGLQREVVRVLTAVAKAVFSLSLWVFSPQLITWFKPPHNTASGGWDIPFLDGISLTPQKAVLNWAALGWTSWLQVKATSWWTRRKFPLWWI